MFEWFCATGGCLSSNSCLLFLWLEQIGLRRKMDNMLIIIQIKEKHINILEDKLNKLENKLY